MNRTIKEILLSAFLGLILPGIMLSAWEKPVQLPQIVTEATGETEARESTLTMQLLKEDGTWVDMDMDEYLVGVVLAEMPASFETEALKAQAVVARTYTLKCTETKAKHNGRVCGDSACCQAYLTPSDYTGGTDNLNKVRNAVLATSGQVLTYQGKLIEATYFSCSGGQTEDAVAVWGTDYPYLRSVESPGEEQAAHYTDSVSFTPEAFAQALGQQLTGDPESWIGFTTYTSGGGVNTMRIGSVDYKGTELRSRLGLRSTVFTVTATQEQITVTTQGYGHRVGMSQYGADAMALSGSSYSQILSHYYRGTELVRYEN